MAIYANVIIDISHEKLDKTFQYKIPQQLQQEISLGMQVEVPFGTGDRKSTAFVVGLTDTPEYEVTKLKEIRRVVETGIPIESQLIALAGWIRDNYGGTMNHALKTVLPVKQRSKEKKQRFVRLAISRKKAKQQLALFEKKHNTARARLLSQLMEQNSLPYEVVTRKLNVTTSVIRAMEGLGILTVEEKRTYRNPLGDMKKGGKRLVLNEEQKQAVEHIWSDFSEGKRQTYLLRGVTGSGKTAVYIELIEQVVDRKSVV